MEEQTVTVPELQEEICRLTELLEKKDAALDAYQKQQDHYIMQLKRMQADFNNYKRRKESEKEKIIKEASLCLIEKLLPVLDNFERACYAGEKEGRTDSYASGVKMVYHQLMEILTEEGLSQISSDGEEFDPNLHEAVMRVESDEHEANQIVQEVETGYMFNEHVVRAAKVVVAS